MTAPPLDIEEQLIRIRRAREESERRASACRELMAEAEKLSAEERKLYAEGLKLTRDRWLSPLVAVSAIVAAVASVANLLMRH